MDEQVRQTAEEMVREMNRRGELINPGSKQNPLEISQPLMEQEIQCPTYI